MSVNFKPSEWAVQHTPADNAAGTIGRAAVTSKYHYVTSITVCLEGAANAPALIFVLRDSTTGVGNIIWTGKIANLANTSREIVLSGVNIRGVLGQAVGLSSL